MFHHCYAYELVDTGTPTWQQLHDCPGKLVSASRAPFICLERGKKEQTDIGMAGAFGTLYEPVAVHLALVKFPFLKFVQYSPPMVLLNMPQLAASIDCLVLDEHNSPAILEIKTCGTSADLQLKFYLQVQMQMFVTNHHQAYVFVFSSPTLYKLYWFSFSKECWERMQDCIEAFQNGAEAPCSREWFEYYFHQKAKIQTFCAF